MVRNQSISQLILAALLLCATPTFATDQTHSTLPQQNSSFMNDLSLFLQREDAQRYIEQFVGMVVSGGVDATGGTLTHTPTSLIAYPGAYYITETGSVTYVSNSTCYLIANRLTTDNLVTFQRKPAPTTSLIVRVHRNQLYRQTPFGWRPWLPMEVLSPPICFKFT